MCPWHSDTAPRWPEPVVAGGLASDSPGSWPPGHCSTLRHWPSEDHPNSTSSLASRPGEDYRRTDATSPDMKPDSPRTRGRVQRSFWISASLAATHLCSGSGHLDSAHAQVDVAPGKRSQHVAAHVEHVQQVVAACTHHVQLVVYRGGQLPKGALHHVLRERQHAVQRVLHVMGQVAGAHLQHTAHSTQHASS